MMRHFGQIQIRTNFHKNGQIDLSVFVVICPDLLYFVRICAICPKWRIIDGQASGYINPQLVPSVVGIGIGFDFGSRWAEVLALISVLTQTGINYWY